MKFKKWNQICMVLTMAMLFGCSKQDAPPATETSNQETSAAPVTASNQNQEAPALQAMSNEQPSIRLSCLYAMPFGSNGRWLVSEYTNTGSVGILAFKGIWTLVDDLGDSQGQQEDKYTSDTPFIDTVGGTNSPSASHVIAPRETIEIINQIIHGDDGDEQTISATTKANFATMAAGFGFTNLDDLRGDTKFTFEIEKIVPQ